MQRTWSGPVFMSCLGEAGPATLVAPCSMMAGEPLHHSTTQQRVCMPKPPPGWDQCLLACLPLLLSCCVGEGAALSPSPCPGIPPKCLCSSSLPVPVSMHSHPALACRYHLFYQSLPDSADWSFGMAWGHAVSRDLVRWTHQPPALQPSPGSRDADGCFTGSALAVEGQGPVILYTGAPSLQGCCCSWNNLGRGGARACHPCLEQVAARPVLAQPGSLCQTCERLRGAGLAARRTEPPPFECA